MGAEEERGEEGRAYVGSLMDDWLTERLPLVKILQV